ncbi:hypothetical protein SAMN05421767_1133 [Granulicatella balaenopterae]|uniref:Nucleotidyltransferase n=1 Tax=Granulicatella balaenopterae TaxID=137733 RepID=A0A1H9KCW2_9LACT|nr:nucleotidyltransferase domain-containing protein [Granulicatella balaenopterae]SEQ96922.1 hypothetical protein SAMN05421767_1133 [Granulicatella balaenopterae]
MLVKICYNKDENNHQVGGNMQEIIKQQLKEIEIKEQVTILLAVEAGSRTWGFAADNSDYDVRFIYLRRPSDYLRLDKMRDVIEWQLDETLDINGWDLKKFLQLAYKSNATCFEWINSPIVYQARPAEVGILQKVTNAYFDGKKSVYHYWNIAQTNYQSSLESSEISIKKYFHILKSLLSCRYILEIECPVAVPFDDLLKFMPHEVFLEFLGMLIKNQHQTTNDYLVPRNQVIDDFIAVELVRVKAEADQLKSQTPSWQALNHAFLACLNQQGLSRKRKV